MDPATSRALGIAAIYQQPSLFPDLTVAENIALALERQRSWNPIDWRGRSTRAAELLRRVSASIDPQRLAESLSMPEQQLVEIAKAIGADARIVIMDEPTAALTEREVQSLFEVIRRLRGDRVGIVYISHRLEEVFAIADRITVLRDGETVGTVATGGVSPSELIRMMVGRELTTVFPKRDVPLGEVALELRGVSNDAAGVQRRVADCAPRGRSWASPVWSARAARNSPRRYSASPPLTLARSSWTERPCASRRRTDAINAGIAYVPEDRRRHGVVLEMSVAANASLASLSRLSRSGWLDRAAEDRSAGDHVNRLRIKTASVHAAVGTLSGGNQQKVSLARWLTTAPAVLILDEPTQGVDVGSKAEIHGLMQELAARGLAIIMISSELPEILGMSDRIGVMHAGTVRHVLNRQEATPALVLALALGSQ